jgi:hypothetical protein
MQLYPHQMRLMLPHCTKNHDECRELYESVVSNRKKMERLLEFQEAAKQKPASKEDIQGLQKSTSNLKEAVKAIWVRRLIGEYKYNRFLNFEKR